MNIRKIARPAVASALALAFLAAAATSASAAVGDPSTPQPAGSASAGSKGGFFLWDANTGNFADGDPTRVYTRDEPLIASAYSNDVLSEINPSVAIGDAPARPVTGATPFTQTWRFLAEKTDADVIGGTNTWNAYADDAAAGPNGGTMVPDFTLDAFISGPGGIADDIAAGGSYWYGVAYTINNGVTVIGATYREINITAGTGSYTVSPMVLESAPVVKIDTTTALTASATNVAEGTAVTLNATVAPADAAGSVEFFDGATSLGSVTVAAGAASKTTAGLTAGSHSFTAKFLATATHNESTSSAVAVTANGPIAESALVAGNENTGLVTETPESTVLAINAGAALANQTRNVGSFPAGLTGSVTFDAAGTATLDAAVIPWGQATKLYLADSNNNVVAWDSFTLTTTDPKTDDTGLTATVANSGRFYLQAPAATSVNLGTIKRGETTTPVAVGGFKVIDDRDFLTGWNLSLSAVDFAGPGATTIPASALGYAAKGTDLPAGVTALGTKVAGEGAFGIIAEALPALDHRGWRLLDADLTFKAPTNAAKGVHTSTMTLDLVSK